MKQIDPGSRVIPILKGAWFTQRIDVISGTIDILGLRVATYNRANECSLLVKIHTEAGRILHSSVVHAKDCRDNSIIWIAPDNPIAVKGIDVYVSIKSSEGRPGNNLGLWVAKENGSDLLIRKPQGYYGLGLRRNPAISSFPGLGLELDVRVSSFALYYRRKSIQATGMKSYNQPVLVWVSDSPLDSQGVIFTSLFQNTLVKLELINTHLGFEISKLAMVLIPATTTQEIIRKVVCRARQMGVPVILVVERGVIISEQLKKTWHNYIDYVISVEAQSAFPADVNSIVDLSKTALQLEEIRHQLIVRQQPLVSIVFSVCNILIWGQFVVESLVRQSYIGPIELVLVGPSDSYDCIQWLRLVIQQLSNQYSRKQPITCSYVTNNSDTNSKIWQLGANAAKGELIVLSDSGIFVNSAFLKAHVDAHSYRDCVVVIGPVVSLDRPDASLAKLCELEQDIEACQLRALNRGPIYIESFLNCRVGNLSIRRSDISLLDECSVNDQKLSLNLKAILLGYKIYENGGRLKFASEAIAFTVGWEGGNKDSKDFLFDFDDCSSFLDLRSQLSTLILSEKSGLVDDIQISSELVEGFNVDKLKDQFAIKSLFSRSPLYARYNRKLRVITYRWHVPHQYELYKLPYQFDLMVGLGSPISEFWDFNQRPMPANARFITPAQFNEGLYDLAILHFDENVLSYENTNGHLGVEWGATFRWFVENIKLPKVAICHGTPQFHGQYTPGYDGDDLMSVIESARDKLVEYVGDIEVVCNSHQARREWGFKRSRVIWHGFDPMEFPPARYEKGILSPLGPLVTSRPHYRGYYLHQRVFDETFPKQFWPSQLRVPDPDVDYFGNVFALAKYRNYVNELRKYSVYFNPTLRSPMPRARAEPMMCGVVTVNADNHDVDMFIKHGVNGFYSNDPEELRDILLYLLRNPEKVSKIGAKARLTAIEVFNYERYLAEWTSLITDVLG
ncbi:glycosyltransferase [Methylomonas methanica]|uniref:glycosyltransferase n=1 Tax=Methylomonas methanica TaxID=421 RepID=UPI0012F6C192|nr:glycosyltransferase [Methylomonas methanica]